MRRRFALRSVTVRELPAVAARCAFCGSMGRITGTGAEMFLSGMISVTYSSGARVSFGPMVGVACVRIVASGTISTSLPSSTAANPYTFSTLKSSA